METKGTFGFHPVVLLMAAFFVTIGALGGVYQLFPLPQALIGGSALGLGVLLSVRVAAQWQRAVVLRMGKFHQIKGPGPFFLLPLIDSVSYWVDLRTVASPFRAEQTLTKDSVPVDVDEVLFWRVTDPIKAALEVENYRAAISWTAQTALRDVIGETNLAEMLVGRRELGPKLCHLIDARAAAWGISVIAVELRDVRIPLDLQNAMSKQAQAERERLARVILADSEYQAAEKYRDAAKLYGESPDAIRLRGMNILLEGMKNNATIVVVPSSAVDTMGLGTVSGLSALSKTTNKTNPLPSPMAPASA